MDIELAYGTTDLPESRLGVLAAWLLPDSKAIVDAGMRYLPRGGGSQSLLDVGCGNGRFLARAQSAGWNVMGIDIDAKAVEVARKKVSMFVTEGRIVLSSLRIRLI